MNYKQYMPVAIFMLFATGCSQPDTTNQTTKKVQMTHSAYLGKSITLFILDNGSPYASRKLKDGGTIYAWNSRRAGMVMISPYGFADRGDDFMKDECEIRLIVAPNKRIKQIYALNSFYKNWDPSDCSEFLK